MTINIYRKSLIHKKEIFEIWISYLKVHSELYQFKFSQITDSPLCFDQKKQSIKGWLATLLKNCQHKFYRVNLKNVLFIASSKTVPEVV